MTDKDDHLYKVGNQFWKRRSKHGRDKLFGTPKLLGEAAFEYFEWCDKNPFQEAKLVSFEGRSHIENVPKKRPYTLISLCLYLGCHSGYFRKFNQRLRDKGKEKTDLDKDFVTIIRQIEETIRTQKFEGAAAGFFNSNIIARDLGLRDGADLTSDGDKIGGTFHVEIVKPKDDDE